MMMLTPFYTHKIGCILITDSIVHFYTQTPSNLGKNDFPNRHGSDDWVKQST